ncbi:NADH-quinone oxidoreductase subunit NuoH [bacterium (Candidatus Blackallbacteria) CG17_big_fil_post_rev_8_21_14_2_50_48_46]|uniref:NADH-quinone oxidoreductase subunit H n=1 Tax=bacterium (Candidatus Blackallbacteria) CG17_big_fil_post_rev_8_21_14_2_50_48_46 TaxID=2014261 RepID=A0A2M7G5G7_9BACT|nr:MAG: NADH-quinone oxidoreductase subunit NuoH [bacterium (Candidatus Blackallbacteria) CG18_big_fil_WC_8_21_14_2_50_49_26]PIW17134.1 MAG: NADH-quinone oxidoreductase subunit NuoH [bacterium (Candidatus Blackallbacteria) CG17_big_fil_post_rev_8_21_14_2_50_48_46]PIW47828.1 MAG: NADH-quinone oxidoreductase subunit NuoH [bacterium (Candidatus Blackallbacteria) CG13_big_fil_rev_8_21_14_2_50_49_14]
MNPLESIFTQIYTLIMKLTEMLLPAPLYKQFSMQIGIMIGITAILIFGPVTMLFLTWMERKVVARMQKRYGPNRVGPFGSLQPFADGIKMFMKEDIIPKAADPLLHSLAPMLVVMPAVMIFSVLPFGKDLLLVDLNVATIFIMSISSIETVAILMAGWSSHNTYSLISSLRAAAQVISYEIPMGFSMVVVLMMSGSMSTLAIVKAQEPGWFVLTPWGFVGFLIFFISGVAEVNRSPFDMPEAESELIAGFHTEYSGMKFGLFYMAEFLGAFAIAAFSTTFFFGGWLGPAILPSWAWFILKTYVFIFVIFWFRGTLPRFRVDLMLNFCWKYLVPMSLLNILLAALWYYLPAGPVRWGVGWLVGAAVIFGAHQVLTYHRVKRLYSAYERPVKPAAVPAP